MSIIKKYDIFTQIKNLENFMKSFKLFNFLMDLPFNRTLLFQKYRTPFLPRESSEFLRIMSSYNCWAVSFCQCTVRELE